MTKSRLRRSGGGAGGGATGGGAAAGRAAARPAAALARAFHLPAHLTVLGDRLGLLARGLEVGAAFGGGEVAHRGLRTLRVTRCAVALELLDRARELGVLALEGDL